MAEGSIAAHPHGVGHRVLTGLVWRSSPADSEVFVRALTRSGVSALAASEEGAVPTDLVEACRRHRLPLFRVPAEVAFATITENVVRRLSKARASDLKAVLDRHRQLVAGVLEGSGLSPVLELVGRDLGMRCWVLSPSGRVIAGSHQLPDTARPGRTRSPLPDRPPSAAPDRRDRCVAVSGRRGRRVQGRGLVHRLRRRLARVADRAHRADRGTGGDRDARTHAVERSTERRGTPRAGPGTAGGRRGRHRRDISADGAHRARHHRALCRRGGATGATLWPGELRVLLHEILRDPGPIVGLLDDEAVALLPVGEGRDVAGDVAQAVRDLAPGLVGSELSLGVSGIVEAGELRGAVEEARYARGLAAARTDPVCVVGHDELATHVLLLASAPDNVRQTFRLRLLEPLRTYDEVHRADLIRTLETFLRCNGSWTKSAEQMHLHVNSVRYRIQRIEELTGRNLARLEDRVDFFLALRLG